MHVMKMSATQGNFNVFRKMLVELKIGWRGEVYDFKIIKLRFIFHVGELF